MGSKVIYENKNLRGRYERKVLQTENAKLYYQSKGWEVAKITEAENEDGDTVQEIIIVKKKLI